MGPKRMRMGDGEGRRLHNEELNSLNSLPNIIRVIKSKRLRWAIHVAKMEESSSAFKILTDKPTSKIPLARLSRKWEDNIRMDLKHIGINARNLVDFAQDRGLLESPCECDIGSPGSIRHGIS